MASNDDRVRQLEREIERLQRQAAAEKQRADDEARARVAEKQRADDEARARVAEKQRADNAEANSQPTVFFEYIDNTHTCISQVLLIETDPKKTAKGTAANVIGKMYPRAFRRWEAFPQLHRQYFEDLTTLFGDDRLFPSRNFTEDSAITLSPRSRKNEQDIRPYIRAYLEDPASRIINAFLQRTTRPEYAGVEFVFSNHALGTLKTPETDPFQSSVGDPDPGSSQKRKFDSISSLAPDRWGLCVQKDQLGRDFTLRILPSEYKAAHKVRASVFRSILGNADAPPPESFFNDCARRVGNVQRDAVTIAEVLCQAYHYMIMFKRPHGYVTSGDGTVLLLAAPETPDTLLYHYIDHAAVALPITQPETDLVGVPAAQLATLVSLALAADNYPAATSNGLRRDLPRWPSSASEARQSGPSDLSQDGSPSRDDGDDGDDDWNDASDDDDDDDGNDDTRGRRTDRPPPPPPSYGGRGNNLALPLSGDAAGQARPFDRFEPPRSQYCTQRCLLGLCRGGPLDPNCPNTPEHASGLRRATGEDGQAWHAISASDACAMLLEQFTASLSAGFECLARQGLFGVIGTLFKVTLCAYGYTFVAKGVPNHYQSELQKEASFYADPATQHLQGVLMPVYIGCIDLKDYPYLVPTGVLVWHLMFMSWAGESLAKRVPDALRDVDMNDVIADMHAKLYRHGIYHQDVHEPNLAWNSELGRVMAIDFDRAFVMDEGDYTTDSGADSPPPASLPTTIETKPAKSKVAQRVEKRQQLEEDAGEDVKEKKQKRTLDSGDEKKQKQTLDSGDETAQKMI